MDTVLFDAQMKSCLASVLAKYPIACAYLFGSTARGQATPLSDVDIALVVTADELLGVERLKFELEVEERIAACCQLVNADVRLDNDAPVVIRGEIVTDGILILSQDEAAQIEFETRSRSEYFDFKPFIEQISRSQLELIRYGGFDDQHTKSH